MSNTTKIQWADATFNPWIGCTKVSPGCLNCYAENTTRARVLRSRGQETWGKGAKRSRTSAATWKQPVQWNKNPMVCDLCGETQTIHSFRCYQCDERYPRRSRIFPSLCDWLDSEVPIEWLADFLKLIYETPNLDWLLLTKRPEQWRERVNQAAADMRDMSPQGSAFRNWLQGWFEHEQFPENVWIGTSVEDQTRADERIPEFLKIPAKVRFLSCEPLLGPVDLDRYVLPSVEDVQTAYRGETMKWPHLHWVIVGGESGAQARQCNADWIRAMVKQCRAAKVPIFVKQLGVLAISATDDFPAPMVDIGRDDVLWVAGFKDKKGGDMAEWPEELRVREFPEVKG